MKKQASKVGENPVNRGRLNTNAVSARAHRNVETAEQF